jgi:hypothetical protein
MVAKSKKTSKKTSKVTTISSSKISSLNQKSLKSVTKPKRQLSQQQEFEILKLVLDKFLWLGLVVLGFGFIRMINGTDGMIYNGLILMSVGIIILGIFMYTLIKEFEFIY